MTPRHLLAHVSGLPDQRRYYRYLRHPGEVLDAALAEPLVARPGTAFCYSDVGFMVLGELAAAVAGTALDDVAQEVVCAPLGLAATRYRPPADWAGRIAATEVVGGTAKVGVVHDENAEMLGGVAGHAGLFGTAGDLASFAAAWAGDGSPPTGLRAEAYRCQTEGLGGRRGLGWGLRHDTWDNMGDGWPAFGRRAHRLHRHQPVRRSAQRAVDGAAHQRGAFRPRLRALGRRPAQAGARRRRRRTPRLGFPG